MRNLAAKFGKIFDICKKFSKNLVDERGNMPRRGVVPRFSDLEVIALSLTAEQFGVDSESYLFALLKEYTSDFPNLISYLASLERLLLVASTMIVVSSPPTYANKYERTLLKRLMQEKMCFVSIQNRCPFVALPVQSVAD